MVRWDMTDRMEPSCFTCEYNGVDSDGGIPCVGILRLMDGIEQWYTEKELWLENEQFLDTGHYTVMIDPDVKYIGVGCFATNYRYTSCVAGEFSTSDGLSEKSFAASGKCYQWMEVQKNRMSGLSVSGKI